MKLCDVKSLHIQELYNNLQDQDFSRATLRLAKVILRMMFRHVVVWNLIQEDPNRHIQIPGDVKASTRDGQSLTPEEARIVIDAGMKDVHYLIFAFAVVTGLRPAEYSGLKWKYLKLESFCDPANGDLTERGVVHVREIAVHIKGEWDFNPPKTKKGIRDIYFPSSIYYRLMEWKEVVNSLRKLAGKNWTEYDLVFPTRTGMPTQRSYLMLQLRKMLEELNLDTSYTLYSLRYTFATLSLLANESDKVVSERMGHTNINFTKDVYTKVLPQMAQDASDRLEKLLFETSCTTLTQNEKDALM